MPCSFTPPSGPPRTDCGLRTHVYLPTTPFSAYTPNTAPRPSPGNGAFATIRRATELGNPGSVARAIRSSPATAPGKGESSSTRPPEVDGPGAPSLSSLPLHVASPGINKTKTEQETPRKSVLAIHQPPRFAECTRRGLAHQARQASANLTQVKSNPVRVYVISASVTEREDGSISFDSEIVPPL